MPIAGILSGGVDSPGINAAIRAVIRYGAQRGVSVLGFLEGWKGPLEDLVRPLRLGVVDSFRTRIVPPR